MWPSPSPPRDWPGYSAPFARRTYSPPVPPAPPRPPDTTVGRVTTWHHVPSAHLYSVPVGATRIRHQSPHRAVEAEAGGGHRRRSHRVHVVRRQGAERSHWTVVQLHRGVCHLRLRLRLRPRQAESLTAAFLAASSPLSLKLAGGKVMVTVRPRRLPRSAILLMSSPPHSAPCGTYRPWWLAAERREVWGRGGGRREAVSGRKLGR